MFEKNSLSISPDNVSYVDSKHKSVMIYQKISTPNCREEDIDINMQILYGNTPHIPLTRAEMPFFQTKPCSQPQYWATGTDYILIRI